MITRQTVHRHRRRCRCSTAALFPNIARAQSTKALTIGYVPSTLFAPVFVAARTRLSQRCRLQREALADRRRTRCDGARRARTDGRCDRRTFGRVLQRDQPQSRSEVRRVDRLSAEDRSSDRVDDARRSLRRRRARCEHAQRQDRRLARQRRRDVGLLRRADLAQVRLEDERHFEPSTSPRPISKLRSNAKPSTRCSARRRSPRCSRKRNSRRSAAAAPAGIAGTGIFFGPSLLNDASAATAVMKALRRGAADVAGPGYYKPENLAAMSKYINQPGGIDQDDGSLRFPRRLEDRRQDVDRHAERIHHARHPRV